MQTSLWAIWPSSFPYKRAAYGHGYMMSLDGGYIAPRPGRSILPPLKRSSIPLNAANYSRCSSRSSLGYFHHIAASPI